MKPEAPCKDCSERKLKCHSRCKRYKQFRDELRKFETERHEEVWDEYTDYVYVQAKRGTRRGGKAK